MTPFALSPKRLRQWAAVAYFEGLHQTWRHRAKMWGSMLWAALSRPVSRATWRQRIRICHKCPVYDRVLRRCRPSNGSPLGCGCYVPFMAIVKKRCWGDENTENVGWHNVEAAKAAALLEQQKAEIASYGWKLEESEQGFRITTEYGYTLWSKDLAGQIKTCSEVDMVQLFAKLHGDYDEPPKPQSPTV